MNESWLGRNWLILLMSSLTLAFLFAAVLTTTAAIRRHEDVDEGAERSAR